jgi:hypothetical protein
MAEESPSYLGYVQGGGSSITDGVNETYVITINDVVPYFHLANGIKSSLIPVERLTNMTYPINAAMVLSGDANETTYMVEVSNLSWSGESKDLKFVVKPLKYYDGELLKPFTVEGLTSLDNIGLQSTRTGLYFEDKTLPPTNACLEGIGCPYSRYNDNN